MKKLAILMLLILLPFVSCKRDEVVEPPISGPSTLSYILEGSANPTTLIITFTPSTSMITVRLHDFTGKPIPGASIFFETLWTWTLVTRTYDKYGALLKKEEEKGGGRANFGNFDGSDTKLSYTDPNGYVNVLYTAPDWYEYSRRTYWVYESGSPDNPRIVENILYITSFYIRAHWMSPPNSKMWIYCDIPLILKVQ